MKNFSIILSTVAIIIASVSLIAASKNRSASLEDSVLEIVSNNPKVVVDALQAFQDQQRAEEERAAAEAIAKYAPEINKADNAPSYGPKDAKVTVVEFFDFSCGYCKHLAPAIEKVMADNNDVLFVFKPLSFVSPVSSYQAKAGIAAHNQNKFAEFYKEIMGAEGRMTEASVDEIAKKVGLNFDQFKNDINNTKTEEALKEINTLAQNIQVNGVPTLFINGAHVSARDSESLQSAINNAK